AAVAAQVQREAGRLAPEGYSPIGSYPDEQLLALNAALAAASGQSAELVLGPFGGHLFCSFARLYPAVFVHVSSSESFPSRINTYIPAEVKKLYPDARFPAFECRKIDAGGGGLEMVYRSSRPLAALAEGLIRGCVAHFGDRIDVRREDTVGAA